MAELIKHGASPQQVLLDDDDSGIPEGGVSLSDFHNFIEKCGGLDALKDKTTEEVCAQYVVKVVTADTKVSYIDHLRIKGLPVSAIYYNSSSYHHMYHRHSDESLFISVTCT